MADRSESSEAVDEAMTDAVESVTEVAENVNEDVQSGDTSVKEGTQEIETAVRETAADTSEEVHGAASADDIADALFRRLRDEGLLPPSKDGTSSPATEAETKAAPAEAEVTQEVERKPEPTHWFYRDPPWTRRK